MTASDGLNTSTLILTLQRITREKVTDALFQVYLTEEDMI